MLLETFTASTILMHLHFITCELLGAWGITSSCCGHAEQWLHDLVKSEKTTLANLHSDSKDSSCLKTAEAAWTKAAEEMLSFARALLDARLYDRATRMLSTAQSVNPRSISSLYRALQGRMLLSNAIVTASSDAHDAACHIQQAMDCFQQGLALVKLVAA